MIHYKNIAGLNVFIDRTNNKDITTFRALLPLGSQMNLGPGMSHFYEHCLVSETKELDHDSMLTKLAIYGCAVNAYTSATAVVTFGECLTSYLREVLHQYLLMVYEPKITELTVNRERNAVLQEIAQYATMPMVKFGQRVGEIQGVGEFKYSPLGTAEQVANATMDDFEKIKACIREHNSSIAWFVKTGLNDEELTNVINDALVGVDYQAADNFKANGVVDNVVKFTEPGRDFTYLGDPAEASSFVLGTQGVRKEVYEFDPLRTSILGRIYSEVLAGGLSSPLYKKLREELQLCYMTRLAIQDLGNQHVWSSITVTNRPDKFEVIKEEVDKIITNAADIVTPEMFLAARNPMVVEALSTASSATAGLDEVLEMANNGLSVENFDYEEYAESLKDISLDEFKEFAKDGIVSGETRWFTSIPSVDAQE